MIIHIPFYKTKVVNSHPSHTSPNHNVSTPKFDNSLHMVI